jgi:hypothetical protein
MANIAVTIDPPLRECFQHCEIHCVSGCCGLDAYSREAGDVAAWGRQARPEAVLHALCQLESVIAAVADRSSYVSSELLHAGTYDEAAREEWLSFLGAFRAALDALI